MTEDEAKKKWCPQVREIGDDPVAYNRNYVGKPVGRCVASECMAWRWSEAKRTVAFLEAVQAHMRTQTKPNFNTAVQAVVYADRAGEFARTEGYCGLAGPVQ